MKLFDPGPRDRSTSLGLLLLRLAAGGMMMSHGIPKLAKFSELKGSFPDPLGIGHLLSLVSAIGCEVGCGLLVVLGLGTRIATLPVVFTMGVAAFIVHGSDPWAKKELAVLYGLVFLAFFFTGAGRFSIDGKNAKSG
ncbi:DoxX [Planctomycetes bacterium Poly30]|uniref:DoxX n=1 Tax=Saltatorellus ferox TaxID=2528018 RepID=A0A518EQA9_9BACT|nr:DoxX [Planctomycetes bacterium Poly30]